MSGVVAALKRFFSPADEPLRVRVYAYAVPALALLVMHGVVTADVADWISGLLGYALLIPVTEWTRSTVAPVEVKRGRHRPKT